MPSRPSTTSLGPTPEALPGRVSFSCPGCSASTEMGVRHQPKRLFGFARNRCMASAEIGVRLTPKWLFVFARDTHLRATLAPITATASRRRTSTRSGSSACDRRHAEHRPRRIQIRSTNKGARNQRQ